MSGLKLQHFSGMSKLPLLLSALAWLLLVLLLLFSSFALTAEARALPAPSATPRPMQTQLTILINDQANLINSQQQQLHQDEVLIKESQTWRQDAQRFYSKLEIQNKQLANDLVWSDIGIGTAVAAIIAEALVIAFRK